MAYSGLAPLPLHLGALTLAVTVAQATADRPDGAHRAVEDAVSLLVAALATTRRARTIAVIAIMTGAIATALAALTTETAR